MINCPISNRPANEVKRGHGDGLYANSDYGGGTYFISRSAMAEVQNADIDLCELRNWVFEQNALGQEWPEISTENWRKIAYRAPKRITQKVVSLVNFMAFYASHDLIFAWEENFPNAECFLSKKETRATCIYFLLARWS